MDKIEAQVVGLFDKTLRQNVLRAPDYFFRDCLEQVLRNANGHLLGFRKSCMRSKSWEGLFWQQLHNIRIDSENP
jgi:hypothetical protein